MSDEINRPAFPSSNEVRCGEWMTRGHAGMTLRDYFAAKAMQAAMTGAQGIGSATDDIRAEAWEAVSRISYEIADAMLKARAA